MTAASPAPAFREYLEIKEKSSTRHEYVVGMIYAEIGTTKRHDRIALTTATRLLDAARGGPCRVYASEA